MAHTESVEVRIRYLTDDLHRELKIKAAVEGKSLNQVILDALSAYVKAPPKKRPK